MESREGVGMTSGYRIRELFVAVALIIGMSGVVYAAQNIKNLKHIEPSANQIKNELSKKTPKVEPSYEPLRKKPRKKNVDVMPAIKEEQEGNLQENKAPSVIDAEELSKQLKASAEKTQKANENTGKKDLFTEEESLFDAEHNLRAYKTLESFKGRTINALDLEVDPRFRDSAIKDKAKYEKGFDRLGLTTGNKVIANAADQQSVNNTIKREAQVLKAKKDLATIKPMDFLNFGEEAKKTNSLLDRLETLSPKDLLKLLKEQSTGTKEGMLSGALQNNNPKLVEALLKTGVDCNEYKELRVLNSVTSPLTDAVNSNNPEMVLMLLDRGARPMQVKTLALRSVDAPSKISLINYAINKEGKWDEKRAQIVNAMIKKNKGLGNISLQVRLKDIPDGIFEKLSSELKNIINEKEAVDNENEIKNEAEYKKVTEKIQQENNKRELVVKEQEKKINNIVSGALAERNADMKERGNRPYTLLERTQARLNSFKAQQSGDIEGSVRLQAIWLSDRPAKGQATTLTNIAKKFGQPDQSILKYIKEESEKAQTDFQRIKELNDSLRKLSPEELKKQLEKDKGIKEKKREKGIIDYALTEKIEIEEAIINEKILEVGIETPQESKLVENQMQEQNPNKLNPSAKQPEDNLQKNKASSSTDLALELKELKDERKKMDLHTPNPLRVNEVENEKKAQDGKIAAKENELNLKKTEELSNKQKALAEKTQKANELQNKKVEGQVAEIKQAIAQIPSEKIPEVQNKLIEKANELETQGNQKEAEVMRQASDALKKDGKPGLSKWIGNNGFAIGVALTFITGLVIALASGLSSDSDSDSSESQLVVTENAVQSSDAVNEDQSKEYNDGNAADLKGDQPMSDDRIGQDDELLVVD